LGIENRTVIGTDHLLSMFYIEQALIRLKATGFTKSLWQLEVGKRLREFPVIPLTA
jgi:hypothetical protein